MTGRNPIIYDGCAPSRDAAISIFNNYTKWYIGLIYSIPYKVNNENNSQDVHVIQAMGIKNHNECGPMGAQNADAWMNKYYPNGTKGPDFYRIIGDTGIFNQSHNNEVISNELYNTIVNVNGTQYNVVNASGDTEVTDPFEIQEINKTKKL